MSLLKFLVTATVEEASIPKKGNNVRKQYNPAPGIIAIRVFADGSVFPSEAAVKKFGLEYQDAVIKVETLPLKDGETVAKTKNAYDFPNGQGFGFDLLDTRVWGQFKGDGNMLFLAHTPKNEPKIDLFGTVNYDEATGKPKISVMDQGAATFGQQVLLDSIQSVYGVTFAVAERVKDNIVLQKAVEGVDFVDMVIFEELEGFNITQAYSKDILLAPKRVIRGAEKGKPDYVRREGVKVYGFAPYAEVFGTSIPDAEVPATSSDSGVTVESSDKMVEDLVEA